MLSERETLWREGGRLGGKRCNWEDYSREESYDGVDWSLAGIWVQGGKAPDRGVKNLYLYVLIGCVCSRAWILYFDSYIRTECNYVVE